MSDERKDEISPILDAIYGFLKAPGGEDYVLRVQAEIKRLRSAIEALRRERDNSEQLGYDEGRKYSLARDAANVTRIAELERENERLRAQIEAGRTTKRERREDE